MNSISNNVKSGDEPSRKPEVSHSQSWWTTVHQHLSRWIIARCESKLPISPSEDKIKKLLAYLNLLDAPRGVHILRGSVDMFTGLELLFLALLSVDASPELRVKIKRGGKTKQVLLSFIPRGSRKAKSGGSIAKRGMGGSMVIRELLPIIEKNHCTVLPVIVEKGHYLYGQPAFYAVPTVSILDSILVRIISPVVCYATVGSSFMNLRRFESTENEAIVKCATKMELGILNVVVPPAETNSGLILTSRPLHWGIEKTLFWNSQSPVYQHGRRIIEGSRS